MTAGDLDMRHGRRSSTNGRTNTKASRNPNGSVNSIPLKHRFERDIAGVLRHQINQIHKVSLSENLQSPCIRLRTDGVLAKKFAAEFNERRLFLGESSCRLAIAHDVNDRRFQSVFESGGLVRGPLV